MSTRMGRPPRYDRDEERPVTISVKAPRALYDELKRYAYTHRQSVTELVLDGIRMRLDTPADPRDMILYDDNTVRQEVQQMVDAAVRLALAAQGPQATRETPRPPNVELSSDDKTVIPKQSQESPVVAAGDLSVSPPVQTPAYDASMHVLGKLCKRGHDWHGTGRSLLRLANLGCLECDAEKARERRKAKAQRKA